jgi:hypothetical protein
MVSKLFQEWTGYEFARTPGSGGMQWHNRSQVSGDIVCTDALHATRFGFSVETKFHKEINFEHLIMGLKGSSIHSFWNQANRDAQRAKKIPMLLMRYNRMPKNLHFICLPQPFFLMIKEHLTLENEYLIYSGLDRIVILNSWDFFKSDYKIIHKLAKTFLKNGKLS